MSERLIIKNFGPIKDFDLELKRFTVLIGEQATGKSTVAKLLAVCRYFSYIALGGFEDGLINWGLTDSLKENSKLVYSNSDFEIKFEAGNDISGGETKGFRLQGKSEAFKSIQNSSTSYNFKHISPPTAFFLNEVSKVMDNPFFFPVERGLQSIFSLGKSSIQNISDSLFNQLARMDQVARQFSNEVYIEPLGIFYKNENGRGFIRKKGDEKYYSLFNAASGYQSAIPIALAIKYYHNFRKKAKTFIIEEPELDLFPDTQKEIVYYLASEMNGNAYGGKKSSVLMTTHSPYILTSMNNLIEAYNIGHKKKHTVEVEKVISREHWINPDDVSVYMLKPDGTCENIMDAKEKIIHAERIDGVSAKLNEEFDALLNIAYSKK